MYMLCQHAVDPPNSPRTFFWVSTPGPHLSRRVRMAGGRDKARRRADTHTALYIYVYIYVYTHICICIHKDVYVCMCVCVYIHLHIYPHTQMAHMAGNQDTAPRRRKRRYDFASAPSLHARWPPFYRTSPSPSTCHQHHTQDTWLENCGLKWKFSKVSSIYVVFFYIQWSQRTRGRS